VFRVLPKHFTVSVTCSSVVACMLDSRNTVVVLIDVQERLAKVIPNIDSIIVNTRLLASYALSDGIPVIVTKQVKLGEIVPELRDLLEGRAHVVEKKTFSCFGSKDFVSTLEKLERKTLVVAGLETHICVLQTVYDALERGYDVVVAVDAIGSQLASDHEYGVRAIEKLGAVLLPAESIVYWLLKSAEHPKFKEALEEVKKRRKALSK